LVIAGIMNPRGNLLEQMQKTIRPRLKDFETPRDAVRLDKVELIFEDRIEAVIEELKTLFREVLNI
jgi:hypothetical protein